MVPGRRLHANSVGSENSVRVMKVMFPLEEGFAETAVAGVADAAAIAAGDSFPNAIWPGSLIYMLFIYHLESMYH